MTNPRDNDNPYIGNGDSRLCGIGANDALSDVVQDMFMELYACKDFSKTSSKSKNVKHLGRSLIRLELQV